MTINRKILLYRIFSETIFIDPQNMGISEMTDLKVYKGAWAEVYSFIAQFPLYDVKIVLSEK